MKPGTREFLLWSSVGLNAALVGALIVMMMRHSPPVDGYWPMTSDGLRQGPTPPFRPPFPPDIDQVTRDLNLSAQQRDEVKVILDNAFLETASDLERMRMMRLRVVRFILKNPQDQEGLDLLLADAPGVPQELAESIFRSLRQMALILDDGQRAKLLAQFETLEENHRHAFPPLSR